MERQRVTTGRAGQLLGGKSTDTIRRWVDDGTLEGVKETEGRQRRKYWVYLDSVQAHEAFPGDRDALSHVDQTAKEAAALLLTASRHLNEAIEAQRKAFEAQSDAVALLLGPNSVEELLGSGNRKSA